MHFQVRGSGPPVIAPSVNSHASTVDFEFQTLRWARNYRRALFQEFAPAIRGRVLEIGAGIGQMSQGFSEAPNVTRFLALEPDPRFHAAFRAAHPRLDLFPGSVESLQERSGWDTLLAINVLEHIEDDGAALTAWAGLLRERRGRLALFVPARPELYSPIDRIFGHFRRYTKQDLANRLAAAGFTVERLHYFNLAGYFAWAVNFRLLRRHNFGQGQVLLFDRLILPILHTLERRIVRPPLGQSLIAIARANPLSSNAAIG